MNKYAEHSRWREMWGCGRKRKFATRAEAETEAKKHLAIETYECHYCGSWHLTKALRNRINENKGNNKKEKGSRHQNEGYRQDE